MGSNLPFFLLFFWATTIVINPALGHGNISIAISLSSRQELFCKYACVSVKWIIPQNNHSNLQKSVLGPSLALRASLFSTDPTDVVRKCYHFLIPRWFKFSCLLFRIQNHIFFKVLVPNEIKRLCQNVDQCTVSFIETIKISAELNSMICDLTNLSSGVNFLSCYGSVVNYSLTSCL